MFSQKLKQNVAPLFGSKHTQILHTYTLFAGINVVLLESIGIREKVNRLLVCNILYIYFFYEFGFFTQLSV